jgi:hypothetical protein
MRVVDNQTDMSSWDLNRAVLSVLDDRRMLNIGNRICWHTIDQKEGVNPLPWVFSVSNKQSSALYVSRGHLLRRQARKGGSPGSGEVRTRWSGKENKEWIESDLQPPNLQILTRHDDLVKRTQDR